MRTSPAKRRIDALDPRHDAEEIYRLLSTYEFPWDTTRALELALYRTYCVPSIGRLLDETKEFEQRTQKRYDDTSLLLAEPLDFGLDSERGREAIRRINRIHARFDISNDDMQYVLSTFVLVPMRWIDRFGWRRLSEGERVAMHGYYTELGRRMGIRDIPEAWQEFAEWAEEYERAQFRYSEASARVGVATRELFVGWFRPVPPALIRPAVHALLDRPVLEAFGLAPASPWLTRALETVLVLRARAMRWLPPRRRPASTRESRLIRSYPNGYEIGELGPDGTPLPGATHPACRAAASSR